MTAFALVMQQTHANFINMLLMEEILHQLIGRVYPIIYRVLYIQGGAGFLPSTIVQYLDV